MEYAEGETWVRRHESAESRAHSPERADGGNGSVLWPVGLNFQNDKVPKKSRGPRHAVQYFGNRTGFTICNFEGEGGPVLGGGLGKCSC